MPLAASRVIRIATDADASACAAIYAPYVMDSAITFETEVPSVVEMAGRIDAANRSHCWVVLEEDGVVMGYAYAHEFAARAAYAWSCTVSVYIASGRRRSGGGRALYAYLFDHLAGRGYRRLFAGVALPNEPSLGLHQSFGFELVGTYRRVGWKLGEWRDVAWLQRDLGDGEPLDPPASTP
jgi:phosphinothricin acetyltransferase